MVRTKNYTKSYLSRFRSFFLTLLGFTLLFSIIPSGHASAFAGGAGTSGDPYQITTPAEMASMSSYLGSGNSGKYFKLMNNIDLNVSPYNTGSGWTPIGTTSGTSSFYGKFDGNFKTISNLYVNSAGSNYKGLFGYTSAGALIQNVLLSNANVTGYYGIGALVGVNYGTITKSGVVGGTVDGGQRVGGLVGSNYGTMTYDYSHNTVAFNPTSSPTCCAGGLTGEANSGGTINNSYSRSNIVITYNIYNQGSVGGLYGNDYSSGAKSNLYSTGSITMVSGSFPLLVGGLAGANYTSTTGSYWDTQTSGRATSSGGAGVVGKTTAQMKTQATYSGWDFSTIWAIDSNGVINDGYPYLQWSSTNSSPTTPTSLGASGVTNGSAGTNTQPAFSFSLSDPDVADTVKYQIQIDDTSDFSSPVVDYTSALAAQGSASFTVGQAAGSGTYTTGSSGQTLANGSYYWRVKAIDNSGAGSSYASANSGSIAFIVDTTAPTTPGTPSTTTPSSTATPTWTWTASTDSGAGLAATPYNLQWSQDNTFVTGVTSSTSATNSFAQPSTLANGTWYFRVRAADTLGNNSSYSSYGAVVIDTTAPTVPGTPSTTSPTSNTSPTWTWAASSDGGVGISVYLLRWSQDSSFASYSNTSTVSTSYTIPLTWAQGTWYFRVAAQDNLSNTSAYSAYGTVVIDTSAPTTPGTPSTTTPSSTATPTWTWTASTDSGAGLAATPYSVQWSKSSTFASGVFSAAVSTNGFTPSALTEGTWYVRVSASDALGHNSSYSSNGFVVIDLTKPIITLIGSDTISLTVGDNYSDLGATATDATDGNLTNSIVKNGFVDTAVNGEYKLTYSVTDSAGNNSTATRTITVLAKAAITTSSKSGTTASTPVNKPELPTTDNSSATILLNDYPEYSLPQGKSLALQPNQKVYFIVNPPTGEPEQHTITVRQVDGNGVTLTISSKPFNISLNIGETKQVDADKDGINDVSITLVGVTNGVVQMVVRQLARPAKTSVANVTTSPADTTTNTWLAVIATGLFVTSALALLIRRRKVKSRVPR